jgi:hypothetical protein
MMKMTKRNWAIALGMATALVVGNTATNAAILKKNGYTRKKGLYYEREGLDLNGEVETKVTINNLVWGVIGIVVGTILNKTVIEK